MYTIDKLPKKTYIFDKPKICQAIKIHPLARPDIFLNFLLHFFTNQESILGAVHKRRHQSREEGGLLELVLFMKNSQTKL